MKPRVLCMLDAGHCSEALEPLRSAAVVVGMPPSQERLLDVIGDFDAFLTSLAVQTDREVLDRASRLRVIATPSTGLDHIDAAYATRKGIRVISLKDETALLDSITATAELAWGLLLAVVRHIPGAFEAAKRGNWARDEFRGHQMSGKTLGVLGYGRLGRMVAEYGKAFRMRVLACDVREMEPEHGVEMVSFATLLRESDVLTIHVHLTEETRGLIGADELAMMKEGAVLINTSRGALIDEQELLRALESGHLSGAGLDVIDGEWRNDLDQHALVAYARTHGNLIITPHVGGVTHESQVMAFRACARMLADYLRSEFAGT